MRLYRSLFALALSMTLGAALIDVQTQRPAPTPAPPQSPLTDPVSRGFHHACWQGDERGCVEAGLRMFDEAPRHQRAAMRTLEQSCQRGHGEACHQLGAVLSGQRATSVQLDEARALLYFVEGCERGFADACTAAGDHSLRGRIVSPDAKAAARHFERGCALGDPDACLYALIALKEDLLLARAAAANDAAGCDGDASRRTLKGVLADFAALDLYRAEDENMQRACKLGLESACDITTNNAHATAADLLCERGDALACKHRPAARDPFAPPAGLLDAQE
jgi:TPR repeat protein